MAGITNPAWIALERSPRSLRAWAIGAQGEALDTAETETGPDDHGPAPIEPALLRLFTPWLEGDGPCDILACGLPADDGGLRAGPFRAVPCAARTDQVTRVPCRDPRLSVRAIPGLRQDRPMPGIMQGGETRVVGFLSENPGFDGVLCLPGRRTRWVHVSADEVVSFQTFLTDEIFAGLAHHSSLSAVIAGDGWDDGAFVEALAEALSRPERLAARLHAIHARAVLDGRTGPPARAALFGALIGAELAAARPYWLGQQVAILGDPPLGGIYARALELQGLAARREDDTRMTLAGLRATHAAIGPGR